MAEAEYAARVINAAQQMLEHARVGQRDFDAAADRRLSGLYAAVTSGRSVTFVLQTMRGHVDGFDLWWESVTARLATDPVAKWFVKLRNNIEKRGRAGDNEMRLHVTYLNNAMLLEAAPPNTVTTFLGDALGRSGWVVALPDGSTETIYFDIAAAGIGSVDWNVAGTPGRRPISELLDEWLSSLQVYIDEARATFMGDVVPPSVS